MPNTCRWKSDLERISGQRSPSRDMLDTGFIRDNLDAVKANCVNRAIKNANPDRVVQLDDDRKRLIQEQQVLQQQANVLQKQVGPEKDPAKKEALKAEGKSLRDRVA